MIILSQIKRAHDQYELSGTTKILNNFITNELSAQYLHYSKDKLYCSSISDANGARDVMLAAYCVISKNLWPIVPFLVEECWSYYGKNNFAASFGMWFIKTTILFADNEPFFKTPVVVPQWWQNSEFDDAIAAAHQLKHGVSQKCTAFKNWRFNVTACVNSTTASSLQVQRESSLIA